MSAHLIPYAGQTAQPHLTPEAKAVRGGWTEARIEKLKELQDEGLSTRLIAEALGGVSKNSVIGKLRRLGLDGRGRPRIEAPRPKRRGLPHRPKPEVYARAFANIEVPKPVPRPRVEVAEPVSKRLTIYQLTDHVCKFPYGDSLPYDYCGNDAKEGSPYCEFHSGVCFNAPDPRRRARAA